MNKQFNRLKKLILKNEFSHLNTMQRQAVFYGPGPMLILAGAGSGKTTTVVNRIAYLIKYGDSYADFDQMEGVADALIQEMERCVKTDKVPPDAVARVIARGPVDPYRILAFTFTNKAANEMKERVERIIGDTAGGMWIGTFHSICVKILRSNIDYLPGFERNFVIYDTDDQRVLIKECLANLMLIEKDYPPRVVAAEIGNAKDKLVTPTQLLNETMGDFRRHNMARVYELYEKRLRENNAVDFDNIINHTIEIFRIAPQVLEYYQRRFEYIMVDEYQDTNKAQYTLISMLAAGHKNLCVVGDDDQSIYGWRGADITNIIEFEREYDDCKVVKLEQNYRSTQYILQAANSVIGNNKRRKEKKLWTEKSRGNKLVRYEAYDERDEGNFVARTILDENIKNKVPFKDCAVLYRTHAQSRSIEEGLVRQGISYRIVGGLRFYERKEIKDILAYLKLVHNPADSVSFRRVINFPKRGIGDVTVDKIMKISEETGQSMLDVIKNCEHYQQITSYGKKFASFLRILDELRESAEHSLASEVIEVAIGASDVMLEYLKEGQIESRARKENMQELINVAAEMEKSNPELTLDEFLSYTSLITDMETANEEEDSVTLMSMHSAKGLEFPVVFIVGMEEGLFPRVDEYKDDEQEMEEERRLCYVSITRAKAKLYMISANSRMTYGKTDYYRKPSRFFEEIPAELVTDYSPKPTAAASAYSRYALPKKKEAPAYKKYEKPASSAGKNTGNFAVGDMVTHIKFGQGVVLSVNSSPAMTILTIKFDKAGTKSIVSSAVKKNS